MVTYYTRCLVKSTMQAAGICHWLVGRRKALLFVAVLVLFGLMFSAHFSYSKHVHKVICSVKQANKYYFGGEAFQEVLEADMADTNSALSVSENIPGSNTSSSQKAEISQSKPPSKKEYHTYVSHARRAHKLERKELKRRLPQALVIGVRKCGTRALLEMMRMHPDIAAANAEQHFFDENYHHGYEWYRKRMPFSTPEQITIEKTPSYFITEEGPSRVKKMNQSLRLIIIVRDPTIRTISDYSQIKQTMASHGKVAKPFEELVIGSDGEIDVTYKAIQISLYQKHLEAWLNYFPMEQIHIVDGDKLISDPFPEMKAVEKFLKLQDYIKSNNFVYNSTKGFYCIHSEIVTKCLSENKGRPHPDVNEAVLKKLRDFFTPFNKLFYERVGRHFKWNEDNR
ncbi:heparan sulfate glucosamine 3-O-sulfotransferase 1-like isoform X1 [Apostichopus japonicus]